MTQNEQKRSSKSDQSAHVSSQHFPGTGHTCHLRVLFRLAVLEELGGGDQHLPISLLLLLS